MRVREEAVATLSRRTIVYQCGYTAKQELYAHHFYRPNEEHRKRHQNPG